MGEKVQRLQACASLKIQEKQTELDAKGCGHLATAVAGALMLFVFCPMSIVAVAAPYWTMSSELQGRSVRAKASLWDVTMTTDISGKSSQSVIGMCSDQMQAFADCGKVHTVRFFVITSLLVALASAIALIVGFCPKATVALRRKADTCWNISCCRC